MDADARFSMRAGVLSGGALFLAGLSLPPAPSPTSAAVVPATIALVATAAALSLKLLRCSTTRPIHRSLPPPQPPSRSPLYIQTQSNTPSAPPNNKPHFPSSFPSLARLLAALLCILYLLALTYLLVQTPNRARAVVHALDPRGTYTAARDPRVDERQYAANCAVLTPGHPSGRRFAFVDEVVRDLFVVAHVAGWTAKGLMLRDRWLSWLLSIGFELVEKSFAGLLPNFKECWWDKWVLDVLVCNFIGMEVGLFLLGSLPLTQSRFFWIARPDKTAPFSLSWVLLDSRTRLISTTATLLAFLTAETNAFFLKTVLWIEVDSFLNIFRLLVWTIIGFPAMSDIYNYLESCPSGGQVHMEQQSLGLHTWLVVAVIVQEIAVVAKLGADTFPQPLSSSFSASTLALWTAVVFVFMALYLRAAPTDERNLCTETSDVQVKQH